MYLHTTRLRIDLMKNLFILKERINLLHKFSTSANYYSCSQTIHRCACAWHSHGIRRHGCCEYFRMCEHLPHVNLLATKCYTVKENVFFPPSLRLGISIWIRICSGAHHNRYYYNNPLALTIPTYFAVNNHKMFVENLQLRAIVELLTNQLYKNCAQNHWLLVIVDINISHTHTHTHVFFLFVRLACIWNNSKFRFIFLLTNHK